MLQRWRCIPLLAIALGTLSAASSRAVVLWSDLGATLVHDSGAGSDILGNGLTRDDSASDTLYFKFHIDPLSDVSTEEYFAGFQLYEGDTERLGVGNSQKAWAYSAFNTAETGEFNKVFGDMDLRSSRPESSSPGVFLPYELPRRGIENTVVFKVQYVPGGDDQVTVWLNPDLALGASEEKQPESLTTKFMANCSFNQIRLRHGGGGGGWTFSDMAIATSFSDFVAGGASSKGPGRGSLPLTFRAWQREQGLPQNSVRAIAQTSDGYLWLGSDDGIIRFDGVRFVSFGLREGLRSGRVRTLLADSSGALWVGTVGGGLAKWQDGKFANFTTQDGLPSDSISALAEDNEKRIWVGTESGLELLEAGKLSTLPCFDPFKGKFITTLRKDKKGAIWVGASGAGVFRFSDGAFTRLNDPSVEALLLDPHCLLDDQSGRLWIGAGDDFVICHDAGQWRRYRISRHLSRPYVHVLAEQPDGTVWAGSVSEGLLQFASGKPTVVNASSGLSDNFVDSLFVDHEGNVWVGTSAGLNRIRHSNLTAFTQTDGLGYGPVQGMAEVAPGIIWACKPGDSLYRYDGRTFKRLTSGDSLRPYPEVSAILAARDGSCWVGRRSGLLHFENPNTSEPQASEPALPGKSILSLAEDRANWIWAGTREGELWVLRGGRWIQQTNCPSAHAITAIAEDSDRSLWIGTEGGGLFHAKDPNGSFEKVQGLLSELVRTLYCDREGTLWIGTAGGGLSHFRNGHIANFTMREGLPDNTVSQILEDDSARLWLGGNRGIACIPKSDLEEMAAGKKPALYPQVYGRLEGMPSEECTGGFSPAGLKTKSGSLWFSTSKGVTVADPHPRETATPPPTVVLEEVLVDGASVKMAKLEIPPGKHSVEFRYTGLSFRAPERVRFRYRLEPLDTDWTDAENRRTAFYGHIPPGEYRFRVAACNSEGIWSAPGGNLQLNVLRHFWQSRWFVIFASVALLVSVAGTVTLMEKRKHQRQLRHLEQERTLERERARIAQDLHDDLGSSLTRLSLLSDLIKGDKDNPAQVETHATKISQSAGQTVRALEEIVWALRPGSDTLQSLVDYIAHFANELFEGDGAHCRLDLPHDLPARPLPPEMRHNIFLIVKEALTNALKHAQATEVRVQAKAANSSLDLTVQDNGHGFDLQNGSPPRKGQGLGNMRRRAEAMGGKLEIASDASKGTTVHLTVRLPVVEAKNGGA